MINRADTSGTSDPSTPLSEVLATNRAGPARKILDPNSIIARYS
jgi:hypothetical protein